MQGTLKVGSVPLGLAFDSLEERLWLTDSAGYLRSSLLPGYQPYTAVRACIPNLKGLADAEGWAVNGDMRGFAPAVCGR